MLFLPDLLTLCRIPLAAALWLAPGDTALLLLLMGLAALTDVLDGWLARRLRPRALRAGIPREIIANEEGRGAWLDPLCDKIFVASLVGALYVSRHPGLGMLLLLGTREVLQLPFVILYHLAPALRHHRQMDFHAGLWGKATTVAQFVTLSALILSSSLQLPLAILTSLLGAMAMIAYLRRAARRCLRNILLASILLPALFSAPHALAQGALPKEADEDQTHARERDRELDEDEAPPPPLPAAPLHQLPHGSAPPPGPGPVQNSSSITAEMGDEEGSGDAQARFEQALVLLRGEKQREAAEALLGIVRDFPNDDVAPESLFEAAQVHEEQLRDPETAERLYGDLVLRYPSSRLSRRAQNRLDELQRGLRTGAGPLIEWSDITATYRTTGSQRAIERLRKLLSEHPDFAFADRALYLLSTAYRDAGRDAEAGQILQSLIALHGGSQWAPRARQVLAEIALQRRRYQEARAHFSALAAYGGLWTSAAADGVAAADRAERRARAAQGALIYLGLLGGFLLYHGRRRLWPPPFEVYYYGPVASFLVLAAYLGGGGPVARVVLLMALCGTLLTWLWGAAGRAAEEAGEGAARGPGARVLLTLVLGSMLLGAVLALGYLVVYHSGLLDIVLETLRYGPE